MSDLLGIGASGLRAYSRALTTVGDNIANAQTPGYARRTIGLREMPTSGDPGLLRVQVRASGVDIAGVTRATDVWLAEEARLAAGDDARTSLRLEAATAIESALADGGNGISSALTAFFNTADELAADPSSAALRGQLLDQVDQIAAGFRSTASSLERLANQQVVAATNEVDALNTDLQALEKVNDGLRRSRAGSTGEAALLDERDRLLNQIAGRMDISIGYENRGTVNVRAATGGDLLVGGGSAQTLSLNVGANGSIAYAIGGQPLAISAGALAGISEAAAMIQAERSATDTAANSIAAQINTAHQAGRDQSGAPGAALFTGGPGAASLTAASLPPSAVAAADANSDNGNIRSFANMRNGNGPEATWSNHVTRQAQTTARARAQDEAASIRFDQASAARDAVSEVDLDHEAAELVRFQQAYAAAAQTIQVARETMQALFNAI